MENNYYAVIECEYQASVKGVWSKVSFRKTIHHKYMDSETVSELITLIKKFAKENNAMITFIIDNLDWYGEGISCCRLLNKSCLGEVKYEQITWNDSEHTGNYNDISKVEISTRDLKKCVESFIFRFNKYVVEKLTESDDNVQ